jgi:hypothetical protein
VNSVMAQLRRQFQATWRAGFHTQPATFALLGIDGDITAWWC